MPLNSFAEDIVSQRDQQIGLGTFSRVFLIENHDHAYYIWRDAGVKNRILIHIDAHHDMWWVEDKAPITIANFICPALKEGIVSEIFWVVPDATFETKQGRGAVLRFLKKITAKYPGPRHAPKVDKYEISTTVLGKPLRVCALRSLPWIEGSVLLDIDVDFLVIPGVTYGITDKHGPLPWCWPEDLLARLADSGIRTDLATIAYSVEGGYTPLKWKYLGDELAARLKQHEAVAGACEGFELMRQGAVAAEQQDLPTAEQKFQRAARLLPHCAAPSYHLAHLCCKLGRVEEARIAYKHARELDSSYRTAYSSAGFVYFGDKRYRAAESEHLQTLALHPEDAYAYLGLGQIAAQKKHWTQAETLLRKSLAINQHLVDSHRELGRVLARQHRYNEAIQCYERSLKLALAGYCPINAPLLTRTDKRHVLDPQHSLVHARLARLYAATGAIDRAINGYRMSIAGGCDRKIFRIALAWLYFRRAMRRAYKPSNR